MRRLSLSLLLTLALILSSPAEAQERPADLGPRKGSWGAEAGVNPGVSLLYFRSTTSAWTVGVAGYFDRQTTTFVDPSIPLDEETTTFLRAELRMGIRTYGRADRPLRPFSGVAGLIGVTAISGPARVSYGLSAESGAHWFFSPHVSLGTGVRLGLRRESFRSDDIHTEALTGQLETLFLGAVYF